MKNLGIYIHIPFCNSKCSYCDFISFTKCNSRVEKYIDSLVGEIKLYGDKVNKYIIDSIFIGGGTPSSISELYIEKILRAIFNTYNITANCEITIEINPGTLDSSKVKKYMELGINRVSIGLQSTDNKVLKTLGRTHSLEDFNNSIKILRGRGFNNINVDLIFGVPNQTLEDLERDLKYLIKLGVSHIALYGLILEEGTSLYDLYTRNKLDLPDEDLERKLYHRGREMLKEAGYTHYEISNFAKDGLKSMHNLKYWKQEEYLGLGLNSHSYFEEKRFFNTKDLDLYIDSTQRGLMPVESYQLQSQTMNISDYCIFGLRVIEGIDIYDFKRKFGKSIYYYFEGPIKKHLRSGLLEVGEAYIRLSEKGLDLSNLVEVDFLL